MAALDWVLLAVLGLSALVGAWRGLVLELLSALAWVAAFLLAYLLAGEVASRLPMGESSATVRHVLGFVLVFVVAAFVLGALARLARKLVAVVGLRPVDRTLGLAFGLVRGLVLLLALAALVEMTPLKTETWWRGSLGSGVLVAMLRGLKPALPVDLGARLPV